MLNKYLTVFFISMVPLIELRGAIPVGTGLGIPTLELYVICVIANMIPVPFIFFFARKVLIWGCDKNILESFSHFVLKKVRKADKSLKKKREEDYLLPYYFS